jgi:hypothetical protein
MKVTSELSKKLLMLKFNKPIMNNTDKNMINDLIRKFCGNDVNIKWFECQYVNIFPFFNRDLIKELTDSIE